MVSVNADVLVVGAGPAGLCIAGELNRLGVSVVILEEREESSPGSRAIGIHPPTLAALAPSGVTERILSTATRVTSGRAVMEGRTIGEVRFDRLNTRFPFVATAPQSSTERALAAGAPEILRGERVVTVSDAGAYVRVETAIQTFTSSAVVMAAGVRARGLIDVPFYARAYRDRYVMADIPSGSSHPPDTAVVSLDQAGVLESFPLPDGGRRLVAWDADAGAAFRGGETSRLRTAVRARTGDVSAAEAVTTATSFGIRTVLARRMRRGRVWIIGDAAHEISPIGGQGMNLGLLDAVSLAPALASWVRQDAADAALDRWERDRLASARTAARLAGLNTRLGRPRAAPAHGIVRSAVALALRGVARDLPAFAYAMGADRSAAISGKSRR